MTVAPTKTGMELDIQAIQKVEGKNSQVKVADIAVFSLPNISDVNLTTYETDSRYYSLDFGTHQIIAIDPINMPSGSDGLSVPELEKLAREMVALAASEINLNALTPNHGSKIGTYFFHWDDTAKKLDDGSYPYIQVGLTGKGELLGYVNLILFAK